MKTPVLSICHLQLRSVLPKMRTVTGARIPGPVKEEMMKKTAAVLSAAFVLFGLAALLPAQTDNLTNLSVEWMRMPARNAASDDADIVVYNPAALVRLAEGFHFNLGNQSLL